MTSADVPGATTVVARLRSRVEGISLTVVSGVMVAIAPDVRFANWVKRVPVPGIAAYLVVVGAVAIWGCARAWRITLRMDDIGVTVRNYFRTCRFAWPEVSCFEDGAFPGEQGSRDWALSVVPHGGRAVTATATRRATPDPEMLTA